MSDRTVTFIGDPMGAQPQAAYQKMLVAMANKFDTDIVMCVCHGKYDLIPQDLDFDKLYIYAQLLPRETEEIHKIDIKGFTLNKEKIEFWNKEGQPDPCPQGKSLSYKKPIRNSELILDDLGVVMATVSDGAIYVHNDFIHARDKRDLDNGFAIVEYILNYAADKTKLLKHLKSGVEEKSKRVLEEILKSQYKIRFDKEQIQLKASKDVITQYEKGITEAVRKVISTEKIIEALKNNIDDVPMALDKTWKSIEKMKDGKTYSNICLTKTCIKAVTTPITCKFKGEEYAFGRYEVSLYFNGECKIKGLDTRVDNHYDHPHVTNGSVCWGNFSGWIPKLIGSSEFDVALDQVYTFLCHYDEGNPYKRIDAWPKAIKVTEPKKKETVKEEMEILP